MDFSVNVCKTMHWFPTLCGFWKEAPSNRTIVYKWFAKFQNGCSFLNEKLHICWDFTRFKYFLTNTLRFENSRWIPYNLIEYQKQVRVKVRSKWSTTSLLLAMWIYSFKRESNQQKLILHITLPNKWLLVWSVIPDMWQPLL